MREVIKSIIDEWIELEDDPKKADGDILVEMLNEKLFVQSEQIRLENTKKLSPVFYVSPVVKPGIPALKVNKKMFAGVSGMLEHYENLYNRIETQDFHIISIQNLSVIFTKCSRFEWQKDHGAGKLRKFVQKAINNQPRIIIPGR